MSSRHQDYNQWQKPCSGYRPKKIPIRKIVTKQRRSLPSMAQKERLFYLGVSLDEIKTMDSKDAEIRVAQILNHEAKQPKLVSHVNRAKLKKSILDKYRKRFERIQEKIYKGDPDAALEQIVTMTDQEREMKHYGFELVGEDGDCRWIDIKDKQNVNQ